MAISRLPIIGITSYGAYTFPAGASIDTTMYKVVPQFDQARRAVPFCEVTIGMTWVLEGDPLTDDEAQDMVAALTKVGSELRYEGRGFGDGNERINGGAVKDVRHGPHPGPVTLVPVGAGQTTRASWQVSFVIPTCGDRVFLGIAEWNFAVNFALDSNGVSTRTLSGHVVIANPRAPGLGRVIRSADDFREEVTPPLMTGFKREVQNYRLSLDRSRLDYEVVDREMGENTPGLGLLDAKFSESIANESPGNLVSHIKTLRGAYTVAPQVSIQVAWKRFFDTVKDGVRETARQLPRAALVPVSFSATNPDRYSPRQQVEFVMSYRVVNATLADALGKTGMWRLVPNSTYRLFEGAASDALGPRGGAKLVFDVGSDVIIDLCRPGTVPAKDPTPVRRSQYPLTNTILEAGAGIGFGFLETLPADTFPTPSAAKSWLKYEVFIRFAVNSGAILGKTLPPDPLDRALPPGTTWDLKKNLPANPGAGQLPPVVKPGGGQSQSQSSSSQSSGDTFIQHRVTPTTHVFVTGRAIRYGHDIPHPNLVSVDGLPATLLTTGEPHEGFASGVVGNALHPVYGAQWSLHYVVPGLKNAGSLPNPLMG